MTGVERPPGLGAQWAIRAVRCYQVVLGPFLGGRCRFEPSCSAYSILAFRKHGFFRGLGLTIWRLARCQPCGRGGVDYP